MLSLFGRAKEAKPVPSSADAILQMEKTIKLVEQRQKYLQHQCDEEDVKLKAFIKNKAQKREAILSLKKKRICTQQINSLDGAILTLTNQKAMLESHSMNLMIVESMKVGAKAMKEETRRIGDVNGVEDVLATVEECIAEANEINEAISQPLSFIGEAEDDIEQMYLELLEQQEEEGEPELPDVPREKHQPTKAVQKQKIEEDEFAALEKDMGW